MESRRGGECGRDQAEPSENVAQQLVAAHGRQCCCISAAIFAASADCDACAVLLFDTAGAAELLGVGPVGIGAAGTVCGLGVAVGTWIVLVGMLVVAVAVGVE